MQSDPAQRRKATKDRAVKEVECDIDFFFVAKLSFILIRF
jgi:hypothetical protein